MEGYIEDYFNNVMWGLKVWVRMMTWEMDRNMEKEYHDLKENDGPLWLNYKQWNICFKDNWKHRSTFLKDKLVERSCFRERIKKCFGVIALVVMGKYLILILRCKTGT